MDRSSPPDEQSASVHNPPALSSSRRVEEDIRSIPGVVGCRIVWDREGRISEIHVVSSGERPAKMVARDVQSLLLVNHDLAVPYQKVSVVATPQPPGRAASPRAPRPRPLDPEADLAPAPGPPAAPPREAGAGAAGAALRPAEAAVQEPERQEAGGVFWTLEGLLLRPREGQLEVKAYVTGRSGERVSGQSVGSARGEESALLGARAVVAALAGQGPAAGAAVAWVDLAGPVSSPVVVVGINWTLPGTRAEVRWGVGSAPMRGNAVLAGALAALEAMGKLSSERAAGL